MNRTNLVRIAQYSHSCTYCASDSTRNLNDSSRICCSCGKKFSPKPTGYIEKYVKSNK